MGYRIDYQPVGQRKHVKKWLMILIVPVCVLLMILACIYPDSCRKLMLQLVFPGDAELTIAAINSVVLEMETGTSFVDAVRIVCGQVIPG